MSDGKSKPPKGADDDKVRVESLLARLDWLTAWYKEEFEEDLQESFFERLWKRLKKLLT